MSAPIAMHNLNTNNNINAAHNNNAILYDDRAARAAALHQKRLEYAHHRWNPFPPYTHPAIKAITVIVILFLVAAFATYVVFVSLAYADDKHSPKIALQTLNKARRPVEFPAVTVCNSGDGGPDSTFIRPQMELRGCFYRYSNYSDPSQDKLEDCLSSVVYRDTWGAGTFLPCWTFNLKSESLKIPYKAVRDNFLNSLEIYFDTDYYVSEMSISLHEAKEAPHISNLFVPHTFSSHRQLTVIGLQKVETKTINGSKTVTWECNASHLNTDRNVSNILLFYQDLTILSYKESYSYTAVSLIGDIAAAFEILLGLSFFKVYLLILALWIILRDKAVY